MTDLEKHDNTLSVSVPLDRSAEVFGQNMLQAFELAGQVMSRLLEDKSKRAPELTFSDGLTEATKVMAPIVQYWANDPSRLAVEQSKLTRDLVELWGRTHKRFLGEEVEPVFKSQVSDARFNDREWRENPFFDFIKQAYLLMGTWSGDMIEKAEGVDTHQKHKAQFYLTQIVSALSPSNFPLTNPEVLRATIGSNAQNLRQGMSQLLADLQQSGDLLRIRQTDMSAFEVGRNLATTPGKVVYQNEIIQLIQYAPTTPSVREVPLLIIPPWINKFYILDLNPQKSFVKWLVDQGLTVFLVSWVNPDARLSHKTFEDYVNEGFLAAVDAACQITQQPQINALGYCVGGTLVASALAHMAARGDKRVKSCSFLAAQVDFSKAGDLMVFIDDAQLKVLDDLMAQTGFLDGAKMANVFNMLRPKDLIWPYIVNNYLLGKQPFPFDLLYWNSDSTRMPAANHSFYLREFYRHNKLAQGLLKLNGVSLDLSRVMIPIYELATREDHIAPAQSVLLGSKLFGGPVRFVLAGSGHIAGVVNPPSKPKYAYWALEDASIKIKDISSIEDLVAKATEVTGSWWPDYVRWLDDFSGNGVDARTPGSESFSPLEDAPGSYVRN